MATIKDELIAREREWMEVGQRGDFAALERIVGPDFVYTASGQGRWTRQQWMDTARRYELRSFAFLDVEVRPYGDDVAVVDSRYRQEGFIAGVPRSGEFLITDVWVKRDGEWQVVARSSILMSGSSEAPAAPPAVIDPKR